MRCAIISDIHSNLAAFRAVLQDVKTRGGVEQIWCLGDITGYGPNPRECIHLLRQYEHICVAGNHDLGAIGEIALSDFNDEAAVACAWTNQQLGPEDRDYIANLPLRLVKGDFTLAHGSPREPIWEYVLSISDARVNFEYFHTRACLVGHTHVPLIFEHIVKSEKYLVHETSPDKTLELMENRLIINPGSVGQPRDGDPRASYVIYDSEYTSIHYYRVHYDIIVTQQKMREYNLPYHLITRLEHGW